MKLFFLYVIAAASWGLSLGVQANPTTFNDLAQEDLYQLVSTYPSTHVVKPQGVRAAQFSSERLGAPWSTATAVHEAQAGAETASQASAPMPESQTNALMLAGIGLMAMMALRRRRGD